MNKNREDLFDSEEQANSLAYQEVLSLLNDRFLINPDRFDQIHSFHKLTMQQLEGKIAFSIKNQIENIQQARNMSESCSQILDKSEQEIVNLNSLYEKDQQFHKECEQFEKLSIYKKNIQQMLDQLKYIFNVKAQIEKIELLFEQGIDQYEHINYKLLALTDIRDNVIEEIKKDFKASSKELEVIISEFQTISEFEERFYKTIFEQFEMTLFLSIKNPAHLIALLRIVETGDKIFLSKGKKPIFRDRAIQAIGVGIDKKFDQKLKDCNEAILILEHSKFTANDLILTLDHTVKCFPKHYDIFQLFEERYKLNIEKRIIPFLDDEEKIKKSYGTLIALLNWVDSYETLLSRQKNLRQIQRLGLRQDSYAFIRSKVKSYLPFFLEHIEGLILDYSQKAILKDKEECQTLQSIEKLIKSKQQLVTLFPEDIFHFINQQIDILGPKMKGELFIELIRSICSSLRVIQHKECQNLLDQMPLAEDPGAPLSPVFIATLHINNFYRCMTYSSETKQYCSKFVEGDDVERVEKVFSQDLNKAFNQSIQSFLDQMLKMIFNEVNQQVLPFLFQPKWLNEDLMNQIVSTLKDYLDDIQILLINQIYFNKLCKMVFTQLINCYNEQLIISVRFCQPTIAKTFFPKYLSDLSLLTDKKNKDKKKAGMINTLQNRVLIVPQLEEDMKVILKIANGDYNQYLGQNTIEKITKRLNCFISILQKSKIEIEGLILQVIQIFETNAPYILEVALWIREDCDAQFKQQRLEQIISLMTKMNLQN